jgi:hypothetical protein
VRGAPVFSRQTSFAVEFEDGFRVVAQERDLLFIEAVREEQIALLVEFLELCRVSFMGGAFLWRVSRFC